MDYLAYSVTFAILAFMACLACVPPLLIHIKAKNLAAIVLTLGIAILCFLNALNALIWHSGDQDTWWDGKILCDIEVKLYIGQGVSVDGVILCLFRQIAAILDTEHISLAPSRQQRKITLVIEICLCVVLPSLVMATQYVVQRPRYWVRRIAGCTPSYDNSWPSFLLFYTWPMILCITACVYCAVAMVRLWRHRRELSAVLSDTPGATRSQNYRLISFAVVLLLIYLPFNIVAFAGNMSTQWHIYSWSYIHPSDWADGILFDPLATPSFDRWTQIVTAYILFGFFGLGRDTKQMYRSWFQWLKKCFGQAVQRRN
nr:a-factor receptor [Exophiala xenobiotica]